MTVFRRPTAAAAAGDAIPFASRGDLHLFLLSSPAGTLDYPERVRTTWQHVTSPDLAGWTELEPAVAPGEPGDIDAGGVWTGSVVEHDGRLYLFYTGHRPGADHPQSICLATSDDLVHFTKSEANPLLLPVDGCEDVDWRDPYVFYHEGEGCWWMLLAARLADGPVWKRGVVMLATSADLVHWTVEEEPFYAPGDTYCPECPELWPMDGRWYLVYSRFSEQAGTVYRVADNPRGPFRIPEREALGGRRWYAAKSAPWRDTRVFFGWLHDRVDDGRGTRWLWGGDMTVPRIVTAGPDGALRVAPALEAWESGAAVSRPVAVGRIGVTEAEPLLDALPASARIRLVTEPADVDEVGLDLARADGSYWRLAVSPRRSVATITHEPGPLDDFWADLTGRAAEYREVDGAVLAGARLTASGAGVAVEVLIEGEILEVFVNDDVALTTRICRDQPLSVSLYAQDGAVVGEVTSWL